MSKSWIAFPWSCSHENSSCKRKPHQNASVMNHTFWSDPKLGESKHLWSGCFIYCLLHDILAYELNRSYKHTDVSTYTHTQINTCVVKHKHKYMCKHSQFCEKVFLEDALEIEISAITDHGGTLQVAKLHNRKKRSVKFQRVKRLLSFKAPCQHNILANVNFHRYL